ncbi:hypothetical protein GQ55_7G040000 [Panicum hallii var. hallii]|uniref:Secreted protein n=1 Tax=Panicum hallii var. hallii TaxID=1504633 RepID=A0A2T7CSE4_9POAL|nr:hypothetical protein GQ55_7G040000 [Panicum hallii var. hallii]
MGASRSLLLWLLLSAPRSSPAVVVARFGRRCRRGRLHRHHYLPPSSSRNPPASRPSCASSFLAPSMLIRFSTGHHGDLSSLPLALRRHCSTSST